MHVVDINIYRTAHVQVYNTQSYSCAVLAKFVRRLLVSWRVQELLTEVECLSKDFPHTKGAQVIVKSLPHVKGTLVETHKSMLASKSSCVSYDE